MSSSSLVLNATEASPNPGYRRRVVSSLSPGKQRHTQSKPPTSSSSSNNNHVPTKSSNLAVDRRPPTKPPPLPRCSIAVSQDETCLVSAAGDILVCRGREFAQLMAEQDASGANSGNSAYSGSKTNSALRWCDMECAEFVNLDKSVCNPWLAGSNSKNEDDKSSPAQPQQSNRVPPPTTCSTGTTQQPSQSLRGRSTYEWGAPPQGSDQQQPVEKTTNVFQHLELEPTSTSQSGTLRTQETQATTVTNASVGMDNRDTSIQPTGSNSSASDPDMEMLMDDQDHVLSMPSFDYSHFGNGGNDMLPASPHRNGLNARAWESAEIDVARAYGTKQKRKDVFSSSNRAADETESMAKRDTQRSAPLTPMHGIPTFLPSLSQVRIKQVSAHPRGSHVLMISMEALLFSYGLNDHGQLGIGTKGQSSKDSRKYVWAPTIITPLLENGGKAITCAAGESHSLVVVCTEGRRISKARHHSSRGNRDRLSETASVGVIEMNRVTSSPANLHSDHGNCFNGHDKNDDSDISMSSPNSSDSVLHHQLYGFGRNNFMKIGLVHPNKRSKVEIQQQRKQQKTQQRRSEVDSPTEADSEMDDVLLPHRVALHCTVWPDHTNSHGSSNNNLCDNRTAQLPPRGIFALAASSEHSAALVHRATGDIELYTWGNAAYHALGIPGANEAFDGDGITPVIHGAPSETAPQHAQPKVVPVPTLVESLSYSAKDHATFSASRLLRQSKMEHPVDVSLGPYSSFVVTSKGRCFSFGISYDGMLGHGRGVTEVIKPKEVKFAPPLNAPTFGTSCASTNPTRVTIGSISAGSGHVIALSKSGDVFTWGKNTDGRLGLGPSAGRDEQDSTSSVVTEWVPRHIESISTPGLPKCPPLSGDSFSLSSLAGCDQKSQAPIIQVCAGLDCSIFVTASGKVLSCGKHSGRLGLGEVQADVDTPTQLFGGLSLWHRPPNRTPSRKPSPSPAKNRPLLKRGLTTG